MLDECAGGTDARVSDSGESAAAQPAANAPPPPDMPNLASGVNLPNLASTADLPNLGLRASVARNVQYCCYVACMIVLERS
jgi:hypothetical protein